MLPALAFGTSAGILMGSNHTSHAVLFPVKAVAELNKKANTRPVFTPPVKHIMVVLNHISCPKSKIYS